MLPQSSELGSLRDRALALLLSGIVPACWGNTLSAPDPEVFATDKRCALFGRVVFETEDGTVRPLAEAVVHAREASLFAKTDAEGLFVLPPLPPGAYDLLIEGPATSTQTASLVHKRSDVVIDAATCDLDIGLVRLKAPGALRGMVDVGEPSGEVVVLSGVRVAVVGTDKEGYTDARGEWEIPNLPEGEHEVVALLPGHEGSPPRPVPVAPGVAVAVGSIRVFPAAAEAGAEVVARVVDPSGAALSGIEVTVSAGLETRARGETDADGRLRLSLPSGVYRLRFELEGAVAVELEGVVVLPGRVLGLRQIVLAPLDPSDADQDALPDAVDPDRDNDGILNEDDPAPTDPTRARDTDGDGIPDAIDLDQDGDTLLDRDEVAPGEDGWRTNPRDPDTDGDGARDDVDLCPTVPDPDQRDEDRDGRGDACTFVPIGVLLGFSPEIAGPGDAITISGAGFPSDPRAIALRFGASAFSVRPVAASATELLVRVPERAVTGPISIFLPEGVLRSARDLCFSPPPEIAEVRSSQPRPRGWLDVFGRLEGAACAGEPGLPRLVFTSSTGGTLAADPQGPLHRLDPSHPPSERLRFPIPAGARSGPIYLVRGSRRSAPVDLVLEAGIFIESAEPAAVLPGDLVQVLGRGFSSGGGRLEVVFPPNITLEARPLSDRELWLSVPAGVMPGDLLVRAGHEAAQYPITLRTNGIELARFEPSIARPGHTELSVFGQNLDRVRRVGFSGRVSPEAAAFTTDPRALAVRVPEGVEPGPVTLESEAERATSASRLATIEVDTFPMADATGALARVQRPEGDDLLLFVGGGRYRVLSPEDLSERQGRTRAPFLAGSPTGERIRQVLRRRTSNRALVVSTEYLYVADLDTMRAVGRCPFRPYMTWEAASLEPGERHAFVLELFRQEIMRVDLDTARCDRFAIPVELQPAGGIRPSGPEEVLLAGRDSIARLDLSVSPPGVTPIAEEAWFGHLVLDEEAGLLWGGPRESSYTRAVRLDGSGAPAPALDEAIHFQAARLVRRGRWAFGAHGVLDLATGLGMQTGESPADTATDPVLVAEGLAEAWFQRRGMLIRVRVRE